MEWDKTRRHPHESFWLCGLCTHFKSAKEEVGQQGGECVFIGYSEESKAYRLYNPSTKNFIVSRDVQFIEEEAWDGSIEKTVNVKHCLSHDENNDELAEIHL